MIKTEICNSKSLRSLVESEPTSREKIITVIFDVLSAHFSGFPVATIAEILFREGIARTCAARWSNDRK
jgi:hypothetical protein